MGNNIKREENNINFRINDEIKHQTVRLIYKPINGEGFNEVMSIDEAKRISKEKCLDLIEINSKTSPVIVKLESYSKFLYELKKQAKLKKKNNTILKEIQLNTNISEHDLLIKVKKARSFIEDGNKVKVVLTMKGRELSRREESKTCLYKFITELDGIAVPESMPKDENNRSIVIMKKK